MKSIKLEFRGIPFHYLEKYFEELGAIKTREAFPIQLKTKNWYVEIEKEKMIYLTSTLKVNSIAIHFFAENEKILEQLIKTYRTKTTRAGG